MNDVSRQNAHEEIELLLPWFVNDTLGADDRYKVTVHIEQCRTCRESVDLLVVMSNAVQQAPTTPIVAEPDTDRLFEKIDGDGQIYRRNRALTLATMAAALAVVALLLVQFFNDTPVPVRFETATSANVVVQTDYVLNIVFKSGTAVVDRDRVMRLIDARGFSHADREDNYHATVSLPASSLEELQRFTARVESMPVVQSVEVIAVQLPVRPQQ